MGQSGGRRYGEPGDGGPAVPPQWQQPGTGPRGPARYPGPGQQAWPPDPNTVPVRRNPPAGPQFTPRQPPAPPTRQPAPGAPYWPERDQFTAPPAAPPPAAPSPRPAAHAAPKADGRPRGCARIGCAAIVLVVLGGIGWFAWSVYGNVGGSFKATVTGYTAVDPAELSVGLRVTNTGKTPAVPTCTVDASSPNGAYSGVDAASLTEALQPGQTVATAIPVTITGQGAEYVTSVTVSCTG